MASTIDTLTGTDTSGNNTNKIEIIDRLTTIDINWLNNSYLVDLANLAPADQANAFWSNAYLKYTDTSLGGNFGINTKYGFTPSADVPIAGRLSGREEYDMLSESMNFGMGRRYSEMFDDNEDLLFLEMGDPKFNSLISFVTNAVDYGTSVVANTGRSLAAYYVGRAVGAYIGVSALFVAFPFWGAALFLGGVAVTKFLSAGSDFSYYKLSPSMFKYWRAVNILTSQMGVELGMMTPEFLPKEDKDKASLGMPIKMTSEFADQIRNLIPGLLTDDNYIDVFAVANKTQVLVNKQKTLERAYYNTDGSKTFTYADKIAKQDAMTFSSYLDELFKFNKDTGRLVDNTKAPLTDNTGVIEKVVTGVSALSTNVTNYLTSSGGKSNIDTKGYVPISEGEIKEKKSWLEEFGHYVDSSARHGASFATFRLEYMGAVSETFSNSTKEIPLKDTINNVSSKVKDVMFSVSGGNIISDNLDKAVKYTGDFLMGAAEGVTFGLSNLATALLGGGYFDVPKMWDDSTFEYQKHTFKMRLGGPYGHPLSMMQDMYIPLFMLIAATASQSVGKAGYTSPMLCSAFIKGKLNTPLAIIDSLTIERGVGNMGYDKYGRPLAIDVSFSVMDLTSFITAPVDAGIFGGLTSALDDNSPMSRYIQMLAGRSIYSTKYAAPKARLKYMKLRQGVSMLTDPSAWGTAVGETIGGSVVGSLLNGFSLPNTQLN